MAEEDVKDAIEKNAKGPRRAKGDVGEVQQHSLKNHVAADRYPALREGSEIQPDTRRSKTQPTTSPA